MFLIWIFRIYSESRNNSGAPEFAIRPRIIKAIHPRIIKGTISTQAILHVSQKTRRGLKKNDPRIIKGTVSYS